MLEELNVCPKLKFRVVVVVVVVVVIVTAAAAVVVVVVVVVAAVVLVVVVAAAAVAEVAVVVIVVTQTNFLDIMFMKQQKHIQTSILRKPTTDYTIPNDSYHPTENRLPAITYFSNRMN
jgi:hypothetical protein